MYWFETLPERNFCGPNFNNGLIALLHSLMSLQFPSFGQGGGRIEHKPFATDTLPLGTRAIVVLLDRGSQSEGARHAFSKSIGRLEGRKDTQARF